MSRVFAPRTFGLRLVPVGGMLQLSINTFPSFLTESKQHLGTRVQSNFTHLS